MLSITSVMSFKSTGQVGGKALIHRDGTLIKEYSLDQNKVIKLEDMVMEIEEGRIRVLESNCPNKICVKAGWASTPAQTIVCAPNKVLIEIAEFTKELKYHALSY
jgi:hypothetical protein